jgi:hypothetical protein
LKCFFHNFKRSIIKQQTNKMDFHTEDELWDHITYNYNEEEQMIVLELQSYYEIQYGNNYVRTMDVERYKKNKKKDSTGKLDILAKKYFEIIKQQIDKNKSR